MGNCLDVPEPKGRRRDRARSYRARANPVIVAAPPDVMPAHPKEFYPSRPHPYFYHFPPELRSSHVMPGLPPEHVLMVDPTTGQEYLVPIVDHPYHDRHYYAGYAEQPDVYYSNTPNGIRPKASRRLPEEHQEDEVDKGEARALRRKSREERKTSQGHDNDKLDIRDASFFTTTAIVTATTSTSAATTVVASNSTTSYQAVHVTPNPAMTVERVETSNFERYLPTPPPTPPPQPDVTRDQADEGRDNEIVDNPPTIDQTDFSNAHPVSVSFAKQPDVIIPQSDFEMTEEKQEEEEKKEEEEEEEELPKVVTSQGVQPPIAFSKPARSVDVVITYSILASLESDIVRRLSSLLESSGISVWAERLGDSSRARRSDKTAKAILGSKVVVVILSEGSCDQRFIRDHVALATVINNPIYPVTTQPPIEVIEAMPVELRLQLPNDPEEWTEIGVNNEFSLLFNLRSLARSVQEDVEYLRDKENESDARRITKRFKRQRSLTHNMKATHFWGVHFGHRHSVKWERMQKTVEDEFSDQLKPLVDGQSLSLLLGGLKKKSCEEQHPDTVTKDKFAALCTLDGEDVDVWETIMKITRTEQAVRDIFDTESTVRHLVLENAESLGRQRVIEMLCELLSDRNANVRAVSVVSLSQCTRADDTKAINLVMATLGDEDRLVREAACLALGNLKLHSAVTKLIHVWRNDVISHVREAAFLALSKLDCQQVEEAIRMTQVLSDEIRDLTSEDLE